MRRRRELHQIGGQAVPEGVVIRSPEWWAVAVRRPDGGIHIESHRAAGFLNRHPRLARTPLRGALALADAMTVGLRALAIAARESSAHDGPGERESGSAEIAQGAIIALGFFVLLFIVAPVVLIRGEDPLIVRNLVEGGVRIAIFLGYVLLISRLAGVGRMFAYHGAEHKVIAAFEAQGRPSLEGARSHPTIHVRCGTNFLTLLMIVAAAVFLPVLREPWWLRLLVQIALLPVVAGIAYEVQRVAARASRNPFMRLVTWPGRALQHITTREPTDDQLEVALAAFEELRRREEDGPEPPPPEHPEAA